MKGWSRTSRHEQRESLDGIRMRCLLSLESIQLSAGDLPCLHCCLAIDLEVFSGSDVVVDTEETFRGPRAEDAVGVEPVEEEVGDGAVGEVVACWG